MIPNFLHLYDHVNPFSEARDLIPRINVNDSGRVCSSMAPAAILARKCMS